MTQQKFIIELLETKGVLKIAISINQIIVWKWPGFEWSDIEQGITDKITSCPITEEDLSEQRNLIITRWKRLKPHQ